MDKRAVFSSYLGIALWDIVKGVKILRVGAVLAIVFALLGTLTLAQTQSGREETSKNDQTNKRRAFISKNYSWYQAGKVRVFFSADFAQALGSFIDVTHYNSEFQAVLGRLFRSGALDGEKFYKHMEDLPPAVSHLSDSDVAVQKADVFQAIESYSGPMIKVLHYKVVSQSESHFGTVTYEIWATPSRSETGWGEFHIFRVTAKKRFLVGPKIVEFEYRGSQI